MGHPRALKQRLARGLHDQNHSGMEHGHIFVVAFEGGHGRPVGLGDGVKRLAGFDLVVNSSGLSVEAFDLRRLCGGRLDAHGVGL